MLVGSLFFCTNGLSRRFIASWRVAELAGEPGGRSCRAAVFVGRPCSLDAPCLSDAPCSSGIPSFVGSLLLFGRPLGSPFPGRAADQSSLSFILGHDQVVDAVLDVAVHEGREVVDRVVDAVVGDAPLRVVVGADLGRAVTRRDHRLALRGDLVEVLRVFEVEDARAQLLEGLVEVLELRLLVLALHDDARGDVGQADGRVGRVDRLSAGARGAEDVLADVVHRDFDVELLGFGQHGHRGGRRVHAALRLGLRDALYAVHARLVLERAVDVLSRDLHDDLLVSARGALRGRGDLVAPPLRLDVLGVHAQQVAGEECGLVAARAAADLDDGVLRILRILRDEQQLDLLLHACEFGFEFRDHLAGHFAHLLVLVVGQRVLRLGEVGQRRAVALRGLDDRFELLVLLRQGDELLDVGDHFGVGELLPRLLVFEFQAVQPVENGIVCHKNIACACFSCKDTKKS